MLAARVPAYAALGTATGQLASPRSSSSIRSFERELGPERGHRAPRGSLPVARPASCRRQSDSEPGDTAIASAVAPVRQRRPRSVSPAAAVRTQNAKHKNLPRDLPWIEYFRRKCLACPGLAPVYPFSSIKRFSGPVSGGKPRPPPRAPGKAQVWPRASEGTKRSPV